MMKWNWEAGIIGLAIILFFILFAMWATCSGPFTC